MFPTGIRLYTIKSLKEADAEVVEFNNFKFVTRSFNPYEPHGLWWVYVGPTM